MILKNKKLLIFTSLLTLLPILVGLLLWNRFPEQMVTHWGLNGEADGWGSVPFAVFVPSLLMLATHWLCIFFTTRDPGNKGRNKKVQSLVLWIIPIVSNLSSYLMYSLALGWEFDAEKLMIAPMGILFAILGNYLPKTRKNSTIGIRVPWTFSSDANWNATHRFGGRLWVIGGILTVLSVFLPNGLYVTVFVVVITVMCVAPIVYSYRFYKKEKAEGKVESTGYSGTDKKVLKGTGIFLMVLTVFILYVLFCGNIRFEFREDYLMIDADMYNDYVLYYDTIENIEYREEAIGGTRVGGYGSFRLLMGYFKNDEFGTHIRYTYYKPESCIVLTRKGQTVVLSGETAEETQVLYEQLLDHIS